MTKTPKGVRRTLRKLTIAVTAAIIIGLCLYPPWLERGAGWFWSDTDNCYVWRSETVDFYYGGGRDPSPRGVTYLPTLYRFAGFGPLFNPHKARQHRVDLVRLGILILVVLVAGGTVYWLLTPSRGRQAPRTEGD